MIGLGHMGSGVAENLIRAGHDVTVWDRSPEPLKRLTAKGAKSATAPEATMQGQVLISMLANDTAIRELGLDGILLDKAAGRLIHVNMATIAPAFAKSLAAIHESKGLGYLAAPVFGKADVAAAGKLIVITGGPRSVADSLEHMFRAIARSIVHAGEAPEHANLFKIAGNFMIASAMEGMGEAFSLLRKAGVDAGRFHEMMANSLFACAVYQNYGETILEEQLEQDGFAVRLALKDINLVRDAAKISNMRMPLAELLRKHYCTAIELGWSDNDWSALGDVIARKAGLARLAASAPIRKDWLQL
jgi:3-hydroxyisobutyrate dehydrogenase-like beta-hydroxyacid dehydrogenase